MEGGQVRHRAAGDEEAAGFRGQPAEVAEPVQGHQLDLGRPRAGEPGAEERVEPGGERVGQGAHEVARRGDEREEARVIDRHEPGKEIALQPVEDLPRIARPDRKSIRLNSSHSQISYAVFCLKKKKKKELPTKTQ